ncbi:MAG: M81 family metallopeptidase [Alphaproteobacteria bacterium]|nr:M81 family metallopeptidase [Alphaproteobacteria bacterium]
MAARKPRIALLGLSIECSRWAPAATRADFEARTWLEGKAILSDARAEAPTALFEMPGFVRSMDAHYGREGWDPQPSFLAIAEPGGPIEQELFEWMMRRWEKDLASWGELDGVFIVLHGAALATATEDPDGKICVMARRIVGPKVPIITTLDLHANISAEMVDPVDVFIGYRTNPHLDMKERGEEAAAAMRELLGGVRTSRARIRLPIFPPTVTMLTAKGDFNRPYGEMIDLGQERMRQPPYAGKIMNVSVMGGFAYGDTDKNGLTVVVTARGDDRASARLAHDLAVEIAQYGWDNRAKFYPRLTSLEEATRLAMAVGKDPARKPLAFADVADNPGGGARGNTIEILEAFHKAGAQGVLLGVFNDAALAAEAHRLGEGATFRARFNTRETNEFSRPYEAEARVLKLSDGRCRCRRGIWAGQDFRLGPSAALDLGGIIVIVISLRCQCADPIFFEMFGLDIAKARSVVVKSRGHFRGGFDEFFAHEQIIEVDGPGLTSPILSRFPWKRMPRPAIPLDEGVSWTAPAFAG